jgi:hypothetical protein
MNHQISPGAYRLSSGYVYIRRTDNAMERAAIGKTLFRKYRGREPIGRPTAIVAVRL